MENKVLAGGILLDIQFENEQEFEAYLDKLYNQGKEHKALYTYRRADGTVIIRILQQYNNSPLIKVYDSM